MPDFNLVIDEQKCIHCGLCAKDCIASVISMDENNNPKIIRLRLHFSRRIFLPCWACKVKEFFPCL